MKKSNYIFIENDWGMFIGKFSDNLFHKHYAIQITIPLFEEIQIESLRKQIKTKKATIVPSNVEHNVNSNYPFTLLLINPIKIFVNSNEIFEPELDPINKIQSLSKDLINSNLKAKEFKVQIGNIINELSKDNANQIDDRILKSVEYLKQNKERKVSLTEVAQICHLSESRLLHLFKSETGITFRRAQLWNKISESISSLFQSSITETAYKFGFSDSAHYSRTFKENFGFTPKTFLKNSQFIQV